MSKKHFSILLAVAVIASLAVLLLVPGKTGRDNDVGGSLLLPGAADWINEVSRVSIQSGQETVTLERSDAGWQVSELQGFPADWSRLREVLASLAEARVVERKTDNPAYYDRLGVEDPLGENAGGVLLRLEHGSESTALIVGKSAASVTGQYLRRLDEAGTLLVDQEFELPRGTVNWAQRQIVDIPSSDVAEVEIIHPDGDWIRVEKSDPADSDFTLGSLPEGREITSSWSVNSLGGALSALNMDDVQPAGHAEDETVVRFRLLTFDGTEYTASAWENESGQWVQLQAATVATEASEMTPTDAGQKITDEVATFNREMSGWQFRIPEYKFDTLTKRSESLLQPLEDEPEAGES